MLDKLKVKDSTAAEILSKFNEDDLLKNTPAQTIFCV